MESILKKHIEQHVRNNNLFSPYQFGLISGRSTTLQLLSVLDKWTEALDEGHSVDAIYMDFQKAFDKVPHIRLISKIKNYGVHKSLLNWIHVYLQNRTQYVTIKNKTSTYHPVKSGIPQGTVLGPLLFVMYINDLPESVDSNIYMFADDTKLFKLITSHEDHQELQSDLDNLMTWSTNWKLPFINTTKCKYMHISNNKATAPYSYYLHTHNKGNVNLLVVSVPEENDLGIFFDSGLEFDKHINNKINKVNSIAGLIRRNFLFLDIHTFVLLYKALVRSQLEYASSVWYPYKKNI